MVQKRKAKMCKVVTYVLMISRRFPTKHPRKFVSVEPMMSDFTGVYFDGIELVILGAMTGPGAIPVQPEWIKSVKHPNIFLKDNIKKYM